MKAKKISKDEWRSLINEIDLASFFEYPMWYSLWEKYLQSQSHTFLIDDHLLLSAIELKAAKGSIRFFNSSPAGTYSNLRSLKGALHLNNKDFEQIKNLTSINFIRLSPFSNVTVSIDDSKITHEETQLCQLSADDPVDQLWSRNHLRLLKTARESKLQISIAKTPVDWNSYYLLYKQFVYEKSVLMTNHYSKSLFDYIRLLNDERVKLWLAKIDDSIVAGRLVFYTHDYAVEWHAAGTKGGHDVGSNQLLVYEILKDAKMRGIRIYDFNPSAANQGVIEFKDKFGSIKKDCPVIKSYDMKQRLYLRYTSIKK